MTRILGLVALAAVIASPALARPAHVHSHAYGAYGALTAPEPSVGNAGCAPHYDSSGAQSAPYCCPRC